MRQEQLERPQVEKDPIKYGDVLDILLIESDYRHLTYIV